MRDPTLLLRGLRGSGFMSAAAYLLHHQREDTQTPLLTASTSDTQRASFWPPFVPSSVFKSVPADSSSKTENGSGGFATLPHDDQPLTRSTFVRATAKASPAVIHLEVRPRDEPRNVFSRLFSSSSAGSGFVIDADGTAVTNAHVVASVFEGIDTLDGLNSRLMLVATLEDGRAYEAKVLYLDKVSDVAAVRLLGLPGPLQFAELGSSAALRAGDFVLALGSPLRLQKTVSHGIVSRPDRRRAELFGSERGDATDLLQIDCPISPGSSGGPIIDLEGRVVGIIFAKAALGEGISFAIPVDVAKKVLKHLKDHGRVLRPYIGVRLLELTPTLARQVRADDPNALPEGVESGVLVVQVSALSPAEQAGLRPGDVIVGVHGEPRGQGQQSGSSGSAASGSLSVRQLLDILGQNVRGKVKVDIQRGQHCLSVWVSVKEAADVVGPGGQGPPGAGGGSGGEWVPGRGPYGGPRSRF